MDEVFAFRRVRHLGLNVVFRVESTSSLLSNPKSVEVSIYFGQKCFADDDML